MHTIEEGRSARKVFKTRIMGERMTKNEMIRTGKTKSWNYEIRKYEGRRPFSMLFL